MAAFGFQGRGGQDEGRLLRLERPAAATPNADPYANNAAPGTTLSLRLLWKRTATRLMLRLQMPSIQGRLILRPEIWDGVQSASEFKDLESGKAQDDAGGKTGGTLFNTRPGHLLRDGQRRI
jgi:hypothetical protein